jgi:LPXTG-motif cell wall-anchored protein
MLAAIAVAVAGGGAARAQTDTVSDQDKTFLKAQQETNLVEVSLGKVVMERTTSEKVRELATKLVSDHQQVSELNRALSTKLGLPIPEQPSAEQQATAEKVKSQSGAAFDAAYVTAQVEGHTKSVSAAQKEISSGSHPDVKAFATEYLPKAQMHLQHSQATQADLATGGTGTDAPDLPRTGTGSAPLTAIGLGLATLGLVARQWGRRDHR